MLKSKNAREAARKARDEARNGKDKGKKEKLISSKLTPAQSKNPKINELFLVEGDSAGDLLKQEEIENIKPFYHLEVRC